MRELFYCVLITLVAFGVSACPKAKTQKPDKPIEMMNSQELREVAQGSDDDAKYARVRLAGFDMVNGDDVQKQRAMATVLHLADGGYERAKIELCRKAYWENATEDVFFHCLDMARRGHLGAADSICRVWFHHQDFREALEYCQKSAEAGRPQAYLPYGYALLIEENFQPAYDWLVMAVESGPFEDKVYAVEGLVQIPDEAVFAHEYSLNRRPKTTPGTILISDVIKTLPPPDRLRGKQARCEFEVYYTPTGIAYNVITHCSEPYLDEYVFTYLMNLRSPPPGEYFISKRLSVNWR